MAQYTLKLRSFLIHRHEVGTETVRCTCPSGFKGPRCQQLTVGFSGGSAGAGAGLSQVGFMDGQVSFVQAGQSSSISLSQYMTLKKQFTGSETVENKSIFQHAANVVTEN